MWGSIFIDAPVAVVSFLLAYALRRELLLPLPLQSLDFYWPFVIVSAVLFIFSLALFRTYNGGRALFSLSYLVDYLKGLFLWAALLLSFAFLAKAQYSRFLVLLSIVITIFFSALSRLIAAGIRMSPLPNRDQDIAEVLTKVVDVSRRSPDTLSLLEGLHVSAASGIFYRFGKRLFDIMLAVLGLLFCIPVAPIIAAYIKRDSEGPAIIAQDRIGQNGKRFRLYKFRTMRSDTERYAQAPSEPADARVTHVGVFLRKYSLDELPQFWNVLKGDMSMVGPRPEMPFIVSRYSDWQRMRLSVKPGLTGLWQILGRKDVPLADNLQYDFYYVFHRSFFLDIAIVLRTIPHLLFPKGAY